MKKLFALTAVALLMAACSEEVTTNHPNGDKQYISFSVTDGDAVSGQTQNASTRVSAPWIAEQMPQPMAEIKVVEVETDMPTEESLYLTITDEPFIRRTDTNFTRGALLNSGDASILSFGVTEYPTGQTNIANVKWENSNPTYQEMISSNVALFKAPQTWEFDAYDDVKYDFYAYAPWEDGGSGQGIALSENRQAITYNPYNVPANNQPDLMTARKVTSAYVGAIPLTFHHRLCAIQIKTGSTWPSGYQVKGITFSNVIPSGTFNIDSDKDANWSSYASKTDYVVTGLTAANSAGSEIAGNTGSNWVMMVPQNLTGAKLSITIEDGDHHAYTITAPINNSIWRAGHTITYTVSPESITSMSVSYPLGSRAWSGTENGLVTSYNSGEEFGLFVVDKDGNVIVSNATATASAAGIEPALTIPTGTFYSKQYKYFLMYPKKSNDELLALLGTTNMNKINGTSTNTAATADAFFSDLITAWNPVADQSVLSTLHAQDLQVGMFDGTKFPMMHKMGLANIKMAGSSASTSAETRTLTGNTTDISYSSTTTDNAFYALDHFVTNLPYKVGSSNSSSLNCYFIVNPAKSYTFSTSYKYGDANANKQWDDIVVSPSGTAVSNGSYSVITTSAPKFKNIGRLYSYTSPGSCQTFTASFTCTHKLECWGAKGGSTNASGYSTYGGSNGGGDGGYVAGNISLNQNTTVYIYVGGIGEQYSINGGGAHAGGWNGGGPQVAGSAGSGATDIRLKKNSDITVWNDATSLKSRIIVAGGGGGWDCGAGGEAGGLTGYPGYISTNSFGSNTTHTTRDSGGTQDSGGTGRATGGFGYGGGSVSYNTGGGGSGWYGGGQSTADNEGGAGGSSFISGHSGCNGWNNSTNQHAGVGNPSIIDGVTWSFNKNSTMQMIDGEGYLWPYNSTSKGSLTAMPRPDTSNSTYASGGHTGSGYARITCMPYD